MRSLTRLLIAVLLFGSVGIAQTTSELLQKAIYTQDTTGDLDAAIRLYKQVIASAPIASEVRIQAQRRLEAAEAQRRALVAAGRSKPTWTSVPPAPLATIEGRTYRHLATGLTLDVPEGWRVSGTTPSSDDGEMALLTSADPTMSINVWMIKEVSDLASVNTRLDASPMMKAEARREQGFTNYRPREGSQQRVVIGGHQAMVAIADFTQPDGTTKMAEYMTWIYTEQTRAFFFSRVPADDLERLKPQFDMLVYSANIP